jgi:hypothetical protein
MATYPSGMRRAAVTLVLALVVAAAMAIGGGGSAERAAATVPPNDCGFARVAGKRYNIKTHLIPCRRGKPWAVTYIRSHRKPAGFTCRDYDPKVTKFRFICRKGGTDFLAIRR